MHDYELCSLHYGSTYRYSFSLDGYTPVCTLEQGHAGMHEDHGQAHLGIIYVWEEVTE